MFRVRLGVAARESQQSRESSHAIESYAKIRNVGDCDLALLVDTRHNLGCRHGVFDDAESAGKQVFELLLVREQQVMEEGLRGRSRKIALHRADRDV